MARLSVRGIWVAVGGGARWQMRMGEGVQVGKVAGREWRVRAPMQGPAQRAPRRGMGGARVVQSSMGVAGQVHLRRRRGWVEGRKRRRMWDRKHWLTS